MTIVPATPDPIASQELALKLLILSMLPPTEDMEYGWKVYVQYDLARHDWLLAVQVKGHQVTQCISPPIALSYDAVKGIVDAMVTTLVRAIARHKIEKEDFNVQDYQERSYYDSSQVRDVREGSPVPEEAYPQPPHSGVLRKAGG